jgi:hypothetical protein
MDAGDADDVVEPCASPSPAAITRIVGSAPTVGLVAGDATRGITANVADALATCGVGGTWTVR